MAIFKYFALIVDCILAIGYELNVQQFSFFILVPAILHIMIFYCSPHCYMMHCQPKKIHIYQSPISEPNKNPQPNNSLQLSQPMLNQSSVFPLPFDTSKKQEDKRNKNNKNIQEEVQYQNCKECGLVKWVRMHHCYYCNICVHKYDHHCVLLGICIGEANQKYYLLFLWGFFITSFMQVSSYLALIGNHLWVDEKGYQHVEWLYLYMSFTIIFFVLGIVVVGYLAIYHTYLALRNDTTYEMRKRPEIYYFRGIIKNHPFDRGIIQNIRLMMMANSNSPIEWQRPQRPKIGMNNYRRVSRANQQRNIFDIKPR